MYKLVKEFKVTKDYSDKLMEDFYKHSIVYGQPGFNSITIGRSEMFSDYDLVFIEIYWETYEDYLNFKKSDVHQKAHRDRVPNPNILSHTSKHYSVFYAK